MKLKSYDEKPELEAAEALAFRAIAFIAADEAYLTDFLNRSGVSPHTLADYLEDRDFLTGVLDHLLSDESLLLAFCGNAGIDPTDISRAHQTLTAT